MSRYYPVFLDLSGRRCVVIGGGEVAERKVHGLIEAGGDVTLVSPSATVGLQHLVSGGKVRWAERGYEPGDLAGAFLAIAATDDEQVNRRVHEEARRERALLNVVDVTPLCDFIAPSVVERGPVTVAISTSGTSPALARKLREAMEGWDELAWADAAQVLAEVRGELKTRDCTVPPEAWQSAMDETVLALVQDGRSTEARERLINALLMAAGPSAVSG